MAFATSAREGFASLITTLAQARRVRNRRRQRATRRERGLRATAAPMPFHVPTMDKLEDRVMLSVLTWQGDVNANWNGGVTSVDTNWSGNAKPADGDTLIFPGGAANLSNTNDTTAGNSYTLQFTGGSYTVAGNAITLDNVGEDITSAGNHAVNMELNLAGGSVLSSTSGALTIGGLISGAGGLTKEGAATVSFTNTGNNYTGNTTIALGTLRVGASGVIPNTGEVSLATGSVFDVDFAETIGSLSGTGGIVDLGSGDLAAGTNGNSSTFAGVIQGTGSFTKQGAGTLNLTGANPYTGDTTISGGTLQISGAGSLSDSTDVVLANAAGAIFDVDVSDTVQSLSGGGATGGNVDLASGVTLTTGDAGNDTFDGVIGGAGNLIKQGTGTLNLTRANTYTGDTTINGGTLQVSGGGSLADTTDVVVNTSGTYDVDTTDTIQSLSGSGSVLLDAAATLTTGDAGSDTFSGVISGNGNLTKQGAGTLNLTGANTYTGVTTISAGTLQVSGGGSLSDSTDVVLADVAGAIFDLDVADTIQSLSGGGATGGNVQLAATLTTGDGGNDTYAGILSGVGGLTKQGAGTMTLSGANTYTGVTTVNAGRLDVNGSIADGAAATDVVVNASGALGGTGTVSGVTSVVGGTLSPGNSVGTLNSGDVAFNGSSTFDVEIDGATADQLNVTGTVNLGGATLDILSVLNNPAFGTTYTIINNDGADAITGVFGIAHNAGVVANDAQGNPLASLPQEQLFRAGNRTFQISYAGGDGNDVALTVVSDIVFDGVNETAGAQLVVITGQTYFDRDGDGVVDGFDVNVTGAPLIVITGDGGNNPLTVNYVGGSPVPAGGFFWNGGAGNDSLVLSNGTFNTVTHNFANNTDGTVAITGEGLITYSSLSPIDDNLSATNRVFQFSSAADTITFVNNGADLTIDSNAAEATTFTAPSASLTILGGDGTDTFNFVATNAFSFPALSVTAETITDDANTSLTVTANATFNAGAGGVTLGDNGGDTIHFGTLTFTGTGPVAITEDSGMSLLGASTGTTVTLTAAGNITDDADDAIANVTGTDITLTVTVDGSTIGVSGSDFLEVNATSSLNADTDNATDGLIAVKDTAGGLPLGLLNAGANYVFATAVNGSISDAFVGVNITAANGANLATTGTTGGAIGTSADAIETQIGALIANTNDGGIYISDTNGPGLGLQTITAKQGGGAPFLNSSNQVVVDTDGIGPNAPVVGTHDVTITATGPILLVNTISAPDAVSITSGTSFMDVNGAGNNVLARSATITLSAAGAIGQQADPIETQVESLTVSTTDGSIFLTQNIPGTIASVVAGGAGDIEITSSAESLSLGTITATGDDVTVTNNFGSLLDAAGTISGAIVTLTGKSGIGTAADALETSATNLIATVSDSGSVIHIDEADGLTSLAVKTNAGNVDVSYTGGSLVYTASSGLLNASAAPTLTFETTSGNIVLGVVDAGANVVSLKATNGSILDNGADAVDLLGGTVTLTAKTAIGASGNAIGTTLTTLTATTTTGDIYISETDGLTVGATTGGSDISITSTTGNITLNQVSTPAPGAVTITATAGQILDGNGGLTNVSGGPLTLTSGAGIGTGNALETSVTALTAIGGTGVVLVNNNTSLTSTAASSTGGNITITTNGGMGLGLVDAGANAVTLSATGAMTDANAGANNVTGGTVILTGSAIGKLEALIDKIETAASTLTATTTTGGIYISNNSANLTLTATAVGNAADIDIDTTGNIALNTASAPGDTVKLYTNTMGGMGAITDNNDPAAPLPPFVLNITGAALDVIAPGGFGTLLNVVETSVNEVINLDGGTLGSTLTNSSAILLTETLLESAGTGPLTIVAQSITIADAADDTFTLAGGRSLTLQTPAGAIVFLDSDDTIVASGAGAITIQAGNDAGVAETAAAVLGNLTTGGGNILVTADKHITIGQLNAGAGDVTVNSADGIIIDGNGATLNVIAGSTTLVGNAPTSREAEIYEINRVADAAADEGEAAAKQTSADAFLSGQVIMDAAEDSAEVAKNTATTEKNAAIAAADAQEAVVLALKISKLTADGIALAAEAVETIAGLVSGPAQAVPLTGDGGAETVESVAKGVAYAASVAAFVFDAIILSQEQILSPLADAKNEKVAQELAAISTLTFAIASNNAWKESTSIADAAADLAAIVSSNSARVGDQSTIARDQANVIGTPAAPLGIQITGVVNVTAGDNDSYLQVVGPTSVDLINATGAVTLISTGAISDTADAGANDIVATGLNIVGAGGIGTVANPLETQVPTLNATNTTGGDIVIANNAGAPGALDITGITNSGGGNIIITNTGNTLTGEGITFSGPIIGTGGGGLTINSGSPLTISSDQTMAGAIVESAAETANDGDDLTVNSGVTVRSTGSSVTFNAGDDINIQSGSTIQAATTITMTANNGDMDNAGVNVVVAGALVAPGGAAIGTDPAAEENDIFTITPSAGAAITVDADGGSDTLNFMADGLAVTILGNVITAAGRMPLTFSNFEFVNIVNTSGGGSITLNTAAAAVDTLILTGTGQKAGTFTLNAGVPFSFTGVDSFTFNAGDLDDATTVSPFATSVLPWNVAVAINGEAGTDRITYNNVAGLFDTTVVTATATQSGHIDAPGVTSALHSQLVTFTGVEDVTANANVGEDERLTVNLRDTGDADTATLLFDPDAGDDDLILAGLFDLIIDTDNYVGLTLNGRGGDDTFNVTTGPIPVFVDGGDPIGGSDVLNINSDGEAVTVYPGPENDEGSFVVGANGPVSFDHIEEASVTGDGTGSLTIEGTNGDDDITVIGNGVQDFSVSVNAGPAIQSNDFPTLTINADSGDDDISVTTFDDWDVTVDVNGGDPTAGSDTLIVTGTSGLETVDYTPSTGVVEITGASTATINIASDVEHLFYDGEGGNDTLEITATGLITYRPDAQDIEAGSFTVNSLLPINYSDLGSAGGLTLDGTGTESLFLEGAGLGDTFEVTALGATSGLLRVNGHHYITHDLTDADSVLLLGGGETDLVFVNGPVAGSETVTADLNASSVTFTIAGTDSVSAYLSSTENVFLLSFAGTDTINVTGVGAPSDIQLISVTGDGDEIANITGTTGDDTINVSPTGAGAGSLQEADFGPRVTYSGIDNTQLTVNGGGAGHDVLGILGDTGPDAATLTNTLTDTTATINGGIVTFGTGLDAVEVQGLGGDDTLTIDESNGLIDLPITYAGGPGSDSLILTGGVGIDATYNVGPTVDAGNVVHSDGVVTQTVFFTGLEPVLDTSAGALIVNATGGDNAISYTQGSVAANGLVTVDGFESIEFSNKTSLMINALGGSDTISLNNPNVPTGLAAVAATSASLTVVGGGTDDDVLFTADTAGAAGNSITITFVDPGAAGVLSVGVVGTDITVTLAHDGANVTSTAADVAAAVNGDLTAGPMVNATANEGTGLGLVAAFATTNLGVGADATLQGTITVNGGDPASGSDSLIINGTGDFDNFAYTASSISSGNIAQTGTITIDYAFTGVEHLTLHGLDQTDDDTLDVTTVNAVITPGTDPGTGLVEPKAVNGEPLLNLNYTGIESTVVTGTSAVITGTAEDDTITVSATGIVTTTNELGFNNSVDASAFSNLILNALGGDDDIFITLAELFLGGITVIGGEPGGSDVYSITGEAATAETVEIAPDSSDPTEQVVTFAGTGPTHYVSGIELIRYTGADDALGDPDDTLVVNLGSGGTAARVEQGPEDFDRVTPDSLPLVDFTNLLTFRLFTDIGTSKTGTFVLAELGGAVNHQMDGGDLDTLVVEGSDGVTDPLTVTNPDVGFASITNGVNTVTDINLGGPTGRIQINGQGDDDTVTVDITDEAGADNGIIAAAITFDGGGGSDTLIVTGNPALNGEAGLSSVVYTPGPAVGEGRLNYDTTDGGTAPNMTIDFLNLEPVIDLVPAANLTVNGTDADNAISYTVGRNNTNTADDTTRGRVSIDGFETIDFSNKTTLTINALGGSDTISLNNPNTPTGLTGITVNGGDPTGSDTLIVNGRVDADTVAAGIQPDVIGFNPTAADAGSVTITGLPTVTFATTEHVEINGLGGNDALTVTTPAGAQTITYTPGLSVDSASVRVASLVPMSFTNLGATGTVSLANTGGTRLDHLFYLGTGSDDAFIVAATTGAITLNSQLVVSTPGVIELTLDALAGDDTFDVRSPQPYAGVNLDGGGPSGSDSVTMTGNGTAVTYNPVTLPTGIVSWLPGDGNTSDHVGTNNGTLLNGATFTPAQVGQGFSLDGANDSVSLGNPANLKLAGPLTLQAWVRLSSDFGVGAIKGIITKFTQSATPNAGGANYGFYLQRSATGIFPILYVLTSAGSLPAVVGTEMPVASWTGGFNHVSATYDSATGALSMFVNGVQTGSTSLAPGTLLNAASDATVFIGDDISSGGRAFPGLIDEAEIYNRAVSAAEILAVANAGPLGHSPSGGATLTGGGLGQINLSGVETANMNAGAGAITVNGTQVVDDIQVTPTSFNTATVEIVGHGTLLNTSNTGLLTIGDGSTGDGDTLTVHASAGDDTITVTGALVLVDPPGAGTLKQVNYTIANVESMKVDGHDGSDTFNVTPTTIPIFIDGGDPIGGSDALNINVGANNTTAYIGPESDEGSFLVEGSLPVSYDHIESGTITGDGTPNLTVNGTNDDDDFTFIGTIAELGTFPNRDFTLSTNAGPAFQYVDFDTANLNGLSGDDDFTVDVNLAALNVVINIDGGAPLSGSDELRVVGVDGQNDTPNWTPDAADGGVFDLAGQQPINVDFVEKLFYDGEFDNETLTVNGDGAVADVFIHTPGPFIDSGAIQINSLLGLSYESLGGTGTVTFDGEGQTDTLVALGTAGNDTFSVAPTTGTVNLIHNAGDHVDLLRTSIETLTLDGREGNDVFNLNSASAYTTVNVHGNDPANGDVLNVTLATAAAGAQTATIAPDAVTSTEQDITFTGVTAPPINVAGVELITFTGQTAGTADDILVVNGGSGDHTMRIDNAPVGDTTDRVVTDSLPVIHFTALNTFRAAPSGTGNDVVTFVTRNLGGALPANYQFVGGATDTLIIEGADGAADSYLLTNPSGAPSVAARDNNGSLVTVTETSGLLGRIQFNTLGGDDTLTVDVQDEGTAADDNSIIRVPITFDGGSNSDLLVVQGDSLNNDEVEIEEVVYNPGPAVTEGRLRYENSGNAGLMLIDFINLEPVIDTTDVTRITVNGTEADNSIDYVTGSDGRGRVVVDAFESIEFLNKSELVINGNGGGDTIHINNPATPSGLSTMVVNGGNPTSGDVTDRLRINGVAATTTIHTTNRMITGATGTGGAVIISYNTLEAISVNAGTSSTLAITGAHASGTQNYTYTPGIAADTGLVTTVEIPIDFVGLNAGETLALVGDTFDTGGAGSDTLSINGITANDTFTVAATTGIVNLTTAGLPRATIVPTLIENLNLHGLEGDDTFNVTGPTPYDSILLVGGDPSASDVANITNTGAPVIVDGLGGPAPTMTLQPTAGGVDGILTLTSVEIANLNTGTQNITVRGTSAHNYFDVTPTGTDNASIRVDGKSPLLNTTNTNGSLLTISDTNGNTDQVNVNGTFAGDAIAIVRGTPTTVRVNSLKLITVDDSNVESLLVSGSFGVDTFNVTGAGGPGNLTVDGSVPTVGDTLQVVTSTATVNYGTDPATGVLNTTGGDIGFLGLTTIDLTGDDSVGGFVTVNANDGDDSINLRLNRVTVNDGAEVLFSLYRTVNLDGNNGDDLFNVWTTTLSGVTTVNVTGSDPTASDQIIVNGSSGANTFSFTPTAADAGNVVIGSVTTNFETTESLTLNGQGGNDTVTTNLPGTDDTVRYTPGATIDSASVLVNSLVPMNFFNIGSTGTATFSDAGGSDTLVYDGTDGNDAFTVTNGTIDLRSAFGNHVDVTQTGVESLNLNSFDGDDTFTINASGSWTGGVTVSAGGPTFSDRVTVNGTTGNDTIALTLNPEGDTITGIVGGAITLVSAEHLTVNALAGDDTLTVTELGGGSGILDATFNSGGNTDDTFALTGTADPDTITLTPVSATRVFASANGVGPNLTVNLGSAASSTFTANGGDAGDNIHVNGSNGSETFLVDDDSVAVNSFKVISYTGETLSVDGHQGSDTFNVIPGSVPIFIDGGDPIGILPGDVLNIDPTSGNITFFAGPEVDEGGFLVGANEPVSFNRIETATVGTPGGGGPGPVTGTDIIVSASNAADSITLIARDASTHPGAADGIKDFTVAVNTLAEVLFLNVNTITILTLGGSDEIAIQIPAPNNAVWDVDVTIDGGLPTGSDTVIFGTLFTETANYTPTAPDGGTLEIVEASSTTTLVQIEHLIYDGEDGDDTLNFRAAGTTTYRPGSFVDAGSFSNDGLLPIAFQNLGTGGTLNLVSLGSDDTLVMMGNGFDDDFTLTSSSAQLNSQLPVNHNLTAAETVVLEGGDPSAGSDTATITGDLTSNSIVLDLADQQLFGIGPVVDLVGIEDLTINDNAGTDGDTFTVTNVGAPTNLQFVNLNANSPDTLETFSSARDTTLNVKPVGPGNGSFQEAGFGPLVNYSGFVGGTFTVNGTGIFFDTLAILGHDGVDTVSSTAANVTRNGGVVTFGSQLDRLDIFTFGGNDILTGLTGLGIVSQIDTGEGNDAVTLTGLTANSTVTLGAGNDTAIASGTTAAAVSLFGGDGIDGLIGGSLSDLLDGGNSDDFLMGGPSDDTTLGGDGSDTFLLNVGDGTGDRIEGGAGETDVLAINGDDNTNGYTFFNASGRLGVTGTIGFNAADLEYVSLETGGGADTVTLNNLAPTTIRQIEINFGSDALADSLTINLTVGDDNLDVDVDALTTGVDFTGLSHALNATGITTADLLTVNALAGNDNLKADAGVESLTRVLFDGGTGNDFLSADATLLGGAGNDTLVGGSGVDSINGGDGNDSLEGLGGNDSLDGGAGDDLLDGGDGNDSQVGGTGNDVFLVSNGADSADGGAGTDTVLYNGTEFADTLSLTGNNPITVGGLKTGSIQGVNGNPEIFQVNGFAGNDTLTITLPGGIEARVSGGDGNDTVTGGGSSATLLVNGDAGNDSISTGSAADVLDGGTGDDTLEGNGGNDTTLGGDGSDLFVIGVGDGTDLAEGGGAETDYVEITGDGGINSYTMSNAAGRLSITGTIGINAADLEYVSFFLLGGGDDLTVNDLSGTSLTNLDVDLGGVDNQADILILNLTVTDDNLDVDVNAAGSGLTASGLSHGLNIFNSNTVDSLVVNALAGNDNVKADAGVESLIKVAFVGGTGDDFLSADAILNGEAGNDTLVGGTGNDQISGGDGDDQLTGGPGDDDIDGGAGTDTLIEAANVATPGISFVLSNSSLSGLGSDSLSAIEKAQLTGTNSGDTLDVRDFTGNTTLFGLLGNDEFVGGTGDDAMHGGLGNDTYVLGAEGRAIGNDFVTSTEGGSDTLDFSEASSGITIDLDRQTIQAITPGATLQILGQVENFEGSAQNDHVTVDVINEPRTLSGNNPTYGPTSGDTLVVDAQGQAVTLDGDRFTPGIQPFIIGGNGSITAGTLGTFGDIDYNTFEHLFIEGEAGADETLGREDFIAPAKYRVGRRPKAVETADFNGDGFLDIVVVNNQDATVNVLTNRGNGTFNVSEPISLRAPGFKARRPVSVEAVDLDGDGLPDIVVNNIGSRNMTVLRNVGDLGSDGDADFVHAGAFNVGRQSVGMAAGDIDGDGDADIVVGKLEAFGERIGVLENTSTPGTISFTERDLIPAGGRQTTAVELADMDQDGDLDIVAANTGADRVSILLNLGDADSDGDTDFAAPVKYDVRNAPKALFVGDFDSDGVPDVVAVDNSKIVATVLLGTGDGAGTLLVGPGQKLMPNNFAIEVDAADMNGDGRLDLVMVSDYGNRVDIALGTGNGTFQKTFFFRVGDLRKRGPAALALADLNNDGAIDIITAGFASNNVNVTLRNRIV